MGKKYSEESWRQFQGHRMALLQLTENQEGEIGMVERQVRTLLFNLGERTDIDPKLLEGFKGKIEAALGEWEKVVEKSEISNPKS